MQWPHMRDIMCLHGYVLGNKQKANIDSITLPHFMGILPCNNLYFGFGQIRQIVIQLVSTYSDTNPQSHLHWLSQWKYNILLLIIGRHKLVLLVNGLIRLIKGLYWNGECQKGGCVDQAQKGQAQGINFISRLQGGGRNDQNPACLLEIQSLCTA